MKKSYKVLVAVAATSLLTTVAIAPAAQAGTKQKVCVALDTGGINDKSFNELSYAGAKSAKAKGYASSVEYLPAGKSYDENVKKFVDKKCTVIVGVGYALGDAVTASAKANPGIKYIMVDFPSGGANVKGLTYNTNENSFLAGYMAAGYSKTGVVATYGGAPYPTVTIFMDGFARGVAHYNTVKGKKVTVLGWDTAKKDGTFVGGFSDQAKALQISKNFEQQGADVIFPVAGGLGAATANQSMTGKKSVTIWVDSDGYEQAPQFASVILTSVMKGVGTSVTAAIQEVIDGTFSATNYLGTLENGGTFLAPYHDLESTVDAGLAAEVEQLREDIISGTVAVS